MWRREGTRACVVWLLVAACLPVARSSGFCTALVNVSYALPGYNGSVWRREEAALYGQESPRTPVSGALLLAEPVYGCDGETRYGPGNETSGFVALIQRGNGCTFTDKIRAAESHGAIAAIIYNHLGTDDRVIQMSHPGTRIVAVMMGHGRGAELAELLRGGVAVTVAIEVGRQHGSWISHYSVFFVSVSFFIVTAVTVAYFIFYSAQRLNTARLHNRKQKQLKAEAKKAIGQLKVHTLKQGDQETGPDADSCAVCIEAYKAGDVLSTLTCNHFFHKACIEPWLLEHRTCPMCKCDILKALGVELQEEEEQHHVSLPADFHSSDDSHTLNNSASSRYHNTHTSEQQDTHTQHGLEGVHVETQPHYDNPTFQSEAHT